MKICSGSQAYLSTCNLCHVILRGRVLVVLDIQSKLEPAVIAEYKHLPRNNNLTAVRLQLPDCRWKALIQNTTNMISLIVILHGTLFNRKLLHIALDHSLIISIYRSMSSIHSFSAVVLRSEYPRTMSCSNSN